MELKKGFIDGYQSAFDAETTYTNIKNNVLKEGCRIFAEFDFQKSAESVNVKISFNRLLIFGNPEIGIQLLVQDPRVAINMPIKIQVYENENKQVFVKPIDIEALKMSYEKLDSERLKMIADKLHKVIHESIK